MKQKTMTPSAESIKKRPKALNLENMKRSKIMKRWQLYLMYLPTLIYVILFCYKPMYGVIVAFKYFTVREGYWGSQWAGMTHFVRFFRSYWFPIILKNTLTTSVLTTFLTFPLPIIIALMANEIRNQKLKKTFQIVSYAPHFVTTVVVCSMISLFLDPHNGLICMAVQSITGEVPRWKTEPDAFKWIYIVSQAWQASGWGAMLYYSVLSTVDPNLLEAAQIDGANRFQRVIHINLPRVTSMIVIMLIMRIGNVMSMGFEKAYLMQNDLNILGSEIIATYVYKMGLQGGGYSFGTAVGLFNSVINCVLLISANTVSKKMGSAGMW